MESVVIIGAGPAGLAAGYELVRQQVRPLVLEKGPMVGGIARTETYKGYAFDVGGHRFLTKNKEIEQLWQDTLGDDLIKVNRLSRIYYRNHFFNYPLTVFNALANLGLSESISVLLSYLRSYLRPYPEENTFEEWVTNRFGDRLYRTFFKTYTEKVWGIPCSEIMAEWAAQRIRGLSLVTAVMNAITGFKKAKTLTDEFYYPVKGPGMMWDRFRRALEAEGAAVMVNAEVVRLNHENGRIEDLEYIQNGKRTVMTVSHVVSSMPVSRMIDALSPSPPDTVMESIRGLRHRALLVVGLIVDRPDLFPDQWIYIHNPNTKVGRVQNFKNWSAALSCDPRTTHVGMEYFCDEGDTLWNLPDDRLIEIGSKDLSGLGFCLTHQVVDGFVIRQPMAYPVYDATYTGCLKVIRDYLGQFQNLFTIGRNGTHRYNNMDHSMLSGMLAARNIGGAQHNLWEVNEEASYLEG